MAQVQVSECAAAARAPVWERMSVDEYATMQRAFGATLVKTGDVWWRQVRPCFYRPLLPYRELDPQKLKFPAKSRLGGVQYVATAGVPANSHLDLLLFENPHEYAMESLSQNSRYHVRRAMKKFSIAPIHKLDEFITDAHPVYQSFFERTKYGYKAERTDRREFAKWAQTLFAFPKILVLGAYRDRELVSVSVSYQVEEAAFTATFFSSSSALNDYVSDLMLHAIRERAAASDEIQLIFCSTAGMERGLDDYYLRRGAVLAKRPSMLRLNPVLSFLLKKFKKAEYSKFGALE